jgi:hypothetical protein
VLAQSIRGSFLQDLKGLEQADYCSVDNHEGRLTENRGRCLAFCGQKIVFRGQRQLLLIFGHHWKRYQMWL